MYAITSGVKQHHDLTATLWAAGVTKSCLKGGNTRCRPNPTLDTYANQYHQGCHVASTERNVDGMTLEALLIADFYTGIVLI